MEKSEMAEIRERYPHVYFPNPILEPVWFGKRPNTRVEGTRAIVDQNTGTMYAMCSDQYKIVRYEEIIKMVEVASLSFPEFGKPNIIPVVLQGGAKIVVHCKFPDIKYEIKVGDLIAPYFSLKSSLDLAWKMIESYSAERLVCTNGMRVGEKISSLKKRHVLSLNLDEFSEKIKEGMLHFSEQTDMWKKFVDFKVAKELEDVIWEELPFSKNEKEKIEALVEIESQKTIADMRKEDTLSLWNLNAVLTQYTTHEIKNEVRRLELEPVIEHVLELAIR